MEKPLLPSKIDDGSTAAVCIHGNWALSAAWNFLAILSEPLDEGWIQPCFKIRLLRATWRRGEAAIAVAEGGDFPSILATFSLLYCSRSSRVLSCIGAGTARIQEERS